MRMKSPAYYQDIVLRPGEDYPLPVIANELYNKLHIMFVDAKNKRNVEYALAFPGYCPEGLGKVFRVFAEKIEDLIDLDIPHFCKNSSAYGAFDYKKISPVPEKFAVVKYSRVHGDKDPEKRIEEYRRRFGEGPHLEAKIAATHEQRIVNLPYAVMKSSSTSKEPNKKKNLFLLFIKKEKSRTLVKNITSYGLSAGDDEGGVPEF